MEPFLGQICSFGFNFAPRGWAECNGQLLPISQYSALFSLLGTIYGGDGRTTFGLPDLRGRVAINQGTGPGLTPRAIGAKPGTETNHLTVAQLPPHFHTNSQPVSSSEALQDDPSGHVLAVGEENLYNASPSTNTFAQTYNTGNTGAGQSVNNMQPTLVINYCIALVGVYPSRS